MFVGIILREIIIKLCVAGTHRQTARTVIPTQPALLTAVRQLAQEPAQLSQVTTEDKYWLGSAERYRLFRSAGFHTIYPQVLLKQARAISELLVIVFENS